MAQHIEFEFHFNRVTLTYFTAKSKTNSFFCNHGLINQDKSFKFGILVNICRFLNISPLYCKNVIFRILAIFMGVLDFSKFSRFFSTCFEISIQNLVFTIRWWHKKINFEFHCNWVTFTHLHWEFFWHFFCMFWDISSKLGMYIQYVARHIRFEFLLQWGHFDQLFSEK